MQQTDQNLRIPHKSKWCWCGYKEGVETEKQLLLQRLSNKSIRAVLTRPFLMACSRRHPTKTEVQWLNWVSSSNNCSTASTQQLLSSNTSCTSCNSNNNSKSQQLLISKTTTTQLALAWARSTTELASNNSNKIINLGRTEWIIFKVHKLRIMAVSWDRFWAKV